MSGSVPYLVAGFALTWVVVAVYAWRIEARLDDARDRAERQGGGPRVDAPESGPEDRRSGTPATPAEEER